VGSGKELLNSRNQLPSWVANSFPMLSGDATVVGKAKFQKIDLILLLLYKHFDM
jgi:hypothetical protein